MKKSKSSESGQAIVILVLSIVGLLAFAALAIDGGIIYVERRRVQNAADNSALAAVLALCEEEADIVGPASSVASQNGYDGNGVSNDVTVYYPPANGPHAMDADYVEVVIDSYLSGNFVQLIYSGPLNVQGRAVAYCGTSSTGEEGFPPLPYAVYGGSHSCGSASIEFSGNLNTVDGPVHSNNDWKLSGTNNYFDETITYAGSNIQTESANVFNGGPPQDIDTSYEWPLTAAPLDVAAYRPGGAYSSDPNYHSYSGDKDLSGSLNGIYYATGKITLSDANVNGNVTLVAEDEVDLSGNNHDLSPYINNVLIISNKNDGCSSASAKFSGNQHTWRGIIYAPHGEIEMSGSDNTSVDGCLWGARVKFNANEIYVGNCGAYITGQKSLSLME